MKPKISFPFLSLFLLNHAMAMDPNPSALESFSSLIPFKSVVENPQELRWEKTKEAINSPDRYFKIDSNSQKPYLEQFISQALEFFQQRQIVMEDQCQFLRNLYFKTENYIKEEKNFRELHPFFKDSFLKVSSEKILLLLTQNIDHLTFFKQKAEEFIRLLQIPTIDGGRIFNHTYTYRRSLIKMRSQLGMPGVTADISLPSTFPQNFDEHSSYEKFLAAHAIAELRILDEILYSLVPYMPFETFPSIYSRDQDNLFLKSDYPLLKFLSGELDTPYDPQTTALYLTLSILKAKDGMINNKKGEGIKKILPLTLLEAKEIYIKALKKGEKEKLYSLSIPVLEKFKNIVLEKKALIEKKSSLKLEKVIEAFEESIWEILVNKKLYSFKEMKFNTFDLPEQGPFGPLNVAFFKEIEKIDLPDVIKAYLKFNDVEDIKETLKEKMKNFSLKLANSCVEEKSPTAALPAHIQKYLQNTEKSKIGSPSKKNKKASKNAKLLPLPSPKPLEPQPSIVKENKEASTTTTIPTPSTIPPIRQESVVASSPLPLSKFTPRVVVPEGGWSKKDKQNATEAKSKKVLISQPVKNSSVERVSLFTPIEPIYLSSGQYKILEKILDGKSSAYTITYDQVINLLEEGIGIKVIRSGGSHAHLDTPGQNMKILVDIHDGWTNKFGPATMENLKQLMLNLSLDDNKNIHVKEEE